MNNKSHIHALIIFMVLLPISCSKDKQQINIAVASNFEATLKLIVKKYKLSAQKSNKTLPEINIISNSSGLLTSQIINNAPFDLFLSADDIKTDYIFQKKKLNLPSSIYAIGQLALWIPKYTPKVDKQSCISALNSIKTLAIANPKAAPYGALAQKLLEERNITISKLINATSASSAYLLVREKFVDAGFVPYSMLNKHSEGCIQIFKSKNLSQSMLLLKKRGLDIYQFILSEEIQTFIEQSGYNIYQSP